MNTPLNFWEGHGIFFLIFMALFPRVTLVIITAHPAGWVAWVLWLFFPRFLAAILATYYYWDTNPILVLATWVVAITFSGGEINAAKKVLAGASG